jgi:hypothetical protein
VQKSLIRPFATATLLVSADQTCGGRTRRTDRKDQVTNTIGTSAKFWFAVIMLLGSAMAQNLRTGASPAMKGPAYDVSTGYSYAAMPIHGAGAVSLQGLDLSGSIDWNARLGATLDTSFLRASSVPGTSHQAYILNTQVGPQFYPFERGKTRFFVRALGGAALIDGAAPADKTHIYHGYLVRPSLAFGAGVERAVAGPLALRINGDYLRTLFYDSTGEVLPQNSFRLTASVVFRMRKLRGTGW